MRVEPIEGIYPIYASPPSIQHFPSQHLDVRLCIGQAAIHQSPRHHPCIYGRVILKPQRNEMIPGIQLEVTTTSHDVDKIFT